MTQDNVIPFPPPASGQKIAPCKSCGYDDAEVEQEPAEACGDEYHWVECGDCGARGPRTFYGCRDPNEETIDLDAEAIEFWNNGVPPEERSAPPPRVIHLEVCESCKERMLRFPAERMRDSYVVMPEGLCAECEGKMTQSIRILLSGGKMVYE